MKILNLYACLGGNRYKWNEVKEDIQVTAVELDPNICEMYKQLHPEDKIICSDAHQYLLDHYQEYDFIWSSPPCPTHSKMMKATRHEVKAYPDMKLYQEILFLKHFFKGKWVVENVVSYYDPLVKPYKSSRHYYWSNFIISPCKNLPKLKDSSRANRKQIADYLGFDYPGKNYYIKGNHCPAQILRNCVHPEEGKHIFELALNIINQNKQEQQTLF